MSTIAERLRKVRNLTNDAKSAAAVNQPMGNIHDLLTEALADFPDPDAVGEFVVAAKRMRRCLVKGAVFTPSVGREFDAALAKLEEKP